uniref:Uncharacterized protein n=1 Tax=Odontella aurita TaxID=265563 RepID=A0A7S4NJT7_9STRA|mmetsp:Transcript_9603/g.28798  ORF Transcript_9603/g.28798 Transcript_9603/m.28798 type:complete len:239 (+) Transcript_9603:107-823(+)
MAHIHGEMKFFKKKDEERTISNPSWIRASVNFTRRRRSSARVKPSIQEGEKHQENEKGNTMKEDTQGMKVRVTETKPSIESIDAKNKSNDTSSNEEHGSVKEIGESNNQAKGTEAPRIKRSTNEKILEGADTSDSTPPGHDLDLPVSNSSPALCPRCSAKLVHSYKVNPAPLYCRWKAVSFDKKSAANGKENTSVIRCIECGWNGLSDPIEKVTPIVHSKSEDKSEEESASNGTEHYV